MKVYLKLNNLFFTGKISAKGGIHFVMTDSPAKAREFGSPEAAMSYLEGWNIAIDKNWTLEIKHETPKEKEKAKSDCDYDATERIIADRIKSLYSTYKCSHCNGQGRIPARGGSYVCEFCNGTGNGSGERIELPKDVDYNSPICTHCKGTGSIMNAVCPHCNNGFKKDYKPGGLYQEYRPEDYARKEYYKTDEFGMTRLPGGDYMNKAGETFSERLKKTHPERLKEPATSSFSDICKEADKYKDDYNKLGDLLSELHKGDYELIFLRFADEHIRNYLKIIKERAEKEGIGRMFED